MKEPLAIDSFIKKNTYKRLAVIAEEDMDDALYEREDVSVAPYPVNDRYWGDTKSDDRLRQEAKKEAGIEAERRAEEKRFREEALQLEEKREILARQKERQRAEQQHRLEIARLREIAKWELIKARGNRYEDYYCTHDGECGVYSSKEACIECSYFKRQAINTIWQKVLVEMRDGKL